MQHYQERNRLLSVLCCCLNNELVVILQSFEPPLDILGVVFSGLLLKSNASADHGATKLCNQFFKGVFFGAKLAGYTSPDVSQRESDRVVVRQGGIPRQTREELAGTESGRALGGLEPAAARDEVPKNSRLQTNAPFAGGAG